MCVLCECGCSLFRCFHAVWWTRESGYSGGGVSCWKRSVGKRRELAALQSESEETKLSTFDLRRCFRNFLEVRVFNGCNFVSRLYLQSRKRFRSQCSR